MTGRQGNTSSTPPKDTPHGLGVWGLGPPLLKINGNPNIQRNFPFSGRGGGGFESFRGTEWVFGERIRGVRGAEP